MPLHSAQLLIDAIAWITLAELASVLVLSFVFTDVAAPKPLDIRMGTPAPTRRDLDLAA